MLLFVAMPTTTTTPRDLVSTSTTPAPITPALTLDDDALATGLLDLASSTHRTSSTAYRHATANLAICDRLLTPGVAP